MRRRARRLSRTISATAASLRPPAPRQALRNTRTASADVSPSGAAHGRAEGVGVGRLGAALEHLREQALELRRGGQRELHAGGLAHQLHRQVDEPARSARGSVGARRSRAGGRAGVGTATGSASSPLCASRTAKPGRALPGGSAPGGPRRASRRRARPVPARPRPRGRSPDASGPGPAAPLARMGHAIEKRERAVLLEGLEGDHAPARGGSASEARRPWRCSFRVCRDPRHLFEGGDAFRELAQRGLAQALPCPRCGRRG